MLVVVVASVGGSREGKSKNRPLAALARHVCMCRSCTDLADLRASPSTPLTPAAYAPLRVRVYIVCNAAVSMRRCISAQIVRELLTGWVMP